MMSVLIDGSVLEGGGQILRNSVALSALLQKPVSIRKIRHNRKPPGLKNQHAAGLRLVADICHAQLTGCENKSTEIDFSPGPIQSPGNYLADPQTAGSTTLLLQVSLPTLLFSQNDVPSQLTLRGGTNAASAPQIDYTEKILLPFLSRHFGLSPELTIRKRGYYPKGGGEIHLQISPVRGPLPSITLTERGPIKSITGKAYVAGYSVEMADTIRSASIDTLAEAGFDSSIIDISAVRETPSDAVGRGSGIVLWAESENGCRLAGSSTGLRGEDLKSLGVSAAQELIRNLEQGGCVDEHLQDQIIIFLALASGCSTVRTGPLTLHTRTAIWVMEQFTDAKFVIKEDPEDQTVLISCEGIGYHV